MANEKRDVRILAWPKEAAKLEHSFDSDKACPVSISFENNPANVVIHSTKDNPLNVDMNMSLSAKESIPLCIRLCEPLCAKSDYTIGIDIFDRPVGSITLKGMTRLFNCNEERPHIEKPVCLGFTDIKEKTEYQDPFQYRSLTFSPLGEQLIIGKLGDPPDILKLVFPGKGLRIDFPYPVSYVTVTVNNYSHMKELTFTIYSESSLLKSITEEVDNEVKHITLSDSDITALEIKGGQFESSVIEVCYRTM